MDTRAIETKLELEISEDLDGLSDLELGSEEYKVAVEGLAKLMDRAIDLKKIDADMSKESERIDAELDELEVKKKELDIKEEQFKLEMELKEKQLESDKKDQLIRNGIAIAGIVLPIAVTIWGTLKSLKFEETGTVTTIMGRGFIGKLLPKNLIFNRGKRLRKRSLLLLYFFSFANFTGYIMERNVLYEIRSYSDRLIYGIVGPQSTCSLLFFNMKGANQNGKQTER